MISVEIEGLEKALKDIARYSEETAAAVTKELNATAQLVRNDAVDNAPMNQASGGGLGARGGSLRRLITADPVRNYETFVRSRAKYSEFVEFGTGRRGRASGIASPPRPTDYIYEAKRAWAGMRAQPFMHPAAESNRADHIRRMKAALKPK